MTDALKPAMNPEAITSREDRFLCGPLGVTMFANTCARRQAMVRAGIKALEMLMCKACPLGAIVERNSGGPVPLSDVAQKQLDQHGHVLPNAKPFDDSPGPSKYAKPARRLKVLDGGAKDANVVTLPTVGEGLGQRVIKPDDLPRPKAPPGREPTVLPPPATRIVSGEGGLMVERPGHAPAGPFNEETAQKVAKAIDTDGHEVPPAIVPEQKEETMGGKWSPEAKKRAEERKQARAQGKPGRKPRQGALLGRKPATGATVHFAPPAQLSLQQAVEACELISRIGWDNARSIAAMLDDARAAARTEEG